MMNVSGMHNHVLLENIVPRVSLSVSVSKDRLIFTSLEWELC